MFPWVFPKAILLIWQELMHHNTSDTFKTLTNFVFLPSGKKLLAGSRQLFKPMAQNLFKIIKPKIIPSHWEILKVILTVTLKDIVANTREKTKPNRQLELHNIFGVTKNTIILQHLKKIQVNFYQNPVFVVAIWTKICWQFKVGIICLRLWRGSVDTVYIEQPLMTNQAAISNHATTLPCY